MGALGVSKKSSDLRTTIQFSKQPLRHAAQKIKDIPPLWHSPPETKTSVIKDLFSNLA